MKNGLLAYAEKQGIEVERSTIKVQVISPMDKGLERYQPPKPKKEEVYIASFTISGGKTIKQWRRGRQS